MSDSKWRTHDFTIEEARELPDRVLTTIGGADFLIRDLIVLIYDYYEGRPTGGSLHCCLDDGNMEDRHVRWETEHAKKEGDRAAVLIGTLLLMLPERERFLLYERCYHPREVFNTWNFIGGEGS